MNEPIIIVAPQGAGKTKNAAALKEALGCCRVLDEWNGRDPLRPGDLLLMNAMPETLPRYVRVMTWEAALGRIPPLA